MEKINSIEARLSSIEASLSSIEASLEYSHNIMDQKLTYVISILDRAVPVLGRIVRDELKKEIDDEKKTNAPSSKPSRSKKSKKKTKRKR